MRMMILALAATASACTSRQDVLSVAPMIDEVHRGDYEVAAGCVYNALMARVSGHLIAHDIRHVRVGKREIEVQQAASSGYTGTIYGAVVRLSPIDDDRYRVSVQATYDINGRWGIDAVRQCTAASDRAAIR